MMPPKNLKKSRASIVLTISIFILAIIVFSICAIDAGHVITSRYKTQKVTETLALYMASALNALPADKRNEEAIKDIKENFEGLYSENKISGYYNFKITDIQIKDKETYPKVKVSTETLIPPLFLRYAKVGIIKIRQSAYAKSEETPMPYDSSLSKEDYYTFKAKNLITDKKGDDIKVDYTGEYFSFAGLQDSDGKIRWVEIGSLASGTKTEYTLTDKVTGEKIKAYCIKDSSTFDFNSDPEKTIGLVKYLRIYKTNCTTEELPKETEEGDTEPEPEFDELTVEDDTTPVSPSADSGDTEDLGGSDDTGVSGDSGDLGGSGDTGDSGDLDDTSSETLPEVTILNSVKLIKKSDF